MSTHLINGHSLKGQEREVLQQAEQTGDEILVSKAPLVGDIVECPLRYYQVKFKYLLLLGKPIDGAVINTWLPTVVFEEDAAESKLGRYQEIRKYLLMKSHGAVQRTSQTGRAH